MKLEYPYQLVAFLDKQPDINEPVYGGVKGWYPQIALKRRFKVTNLTEEQLISEINKFCLSMRAFRIQVGSLVKTERMPVKVLEVAFTPDVKNFHQEFIAYFGDKLLSRYPERDGEHYYPHITAEYGGKMVIESEAFANKEFLINKVCLLKDVNDEDSLAYHFFNLS